MKPLCGAQQQRLPLGNSQFPKSPSPTQDGPHSGEWLGLLGFNELHSLWKPLIPGSAASLWPSLQPFPGLWPSHGNGRGCGCGRMGRGGIFLLPLRSELLRTGQQGASGTGALARGGPHAGHGATAQNSEHRAASFLVLHRKKPSTSVLVAMYWTPGRYWLAVNSGRALGAVLLGSARSTAATPLPLRPLGAPAGPAVLRPPTSWWW